MFQVGDKVKVVGRSYAEGCTGVVERVGNSCLFIQYDDGVDHLCNGGHDLFGIDEFELIDELYPRIKTEFLGGLNEFL